MDLDSIDNDVDSRVDGDEEMADVDQHGHPWVPALVHILLLREGKQKLTCLYSGFRGSPLIAHLLKVYSLIGDSKIANVSEVLDLIIPGQL